MMRNFDYKRIFAINKQNRERWLKVCPTLTDESGIYIMTREDENGFKFAYIGQAKHILQRLAQHLEGYEQHIDKSLKVHKLFDREKNPFGWSVDFFTCKIEDLDKEEQRVIKEYAAAGYQLRNVTSGSQGAGKTDIGIRKESKGYRDGLAQGYQNARKYIANLFENNLKVEINGKDGVRKQAALYKFLTFVDVKKDERTEPFE